jgi:prepilin-type N-terminal cleavage/methylation domain-containing protein
MSANGYMRGRPRTGGDAKMCTPLEQPPHKSAGSGGFTLVELVVAMAILVVVLIGVLGSLEFAARATQQASVRQGAMQLATQRIEYARNIPYQVLGTKNADGSFGDPAGILPADGESVVTSSGAYAVAYRVWWMRESDPNPAAQTVMYKKVSVTVSWTAPNAASVSVETAIYGIDTNAVVGDVQILAQDAESLGALSGVSVMIDPVSGPNRTVTTGGDGYVLFGQVPYGAITTMTAALSGYMADYSAFGAHTVAPNVVNTWVMPMQRSKNATVHVQNDGGGTIQGASVMLTNQERGISYGPFVTDASGNTPLIPNLWNATGGGYIATATYNGNSASSTFTVRTTDTSVSSTVVIRTQAQITVTVMDNLTGLALPGATVGMTGPVNPADDGSGTSAGGTKTYTVTRSGTYTIVASKANYLTQTVSFYVDLNNAINPAPIRLAPLARLVITVHDRYSSTVIAGSTVTVRDGSGNTDGSGVTAADGTVAVVNLAPDNYVVSVTANGNYQAFAGSAFAINLNPPSQSQVAYTADAITGRIQVQLRRSGGALPTGTNWVRLRNSSGTVVAGPTQVPTATGNVLFGPLPTGTLTVQRSTSSGGTYTTLGTRAVASGVFAPYVVTYTGSY